MAPQKRDSQATKSKILKNAILLFSQKGFDATTVDDIAKKSGVNKAMIYYYFTNKSKLYEDLMANLFSDINREIINSDKCCSNALGELKMFIQIYAKYCEKHPYLPTLMLRELSNGGNNLPDLMFAGMRELFALLSDILERGQKEGLFKNVIPIVIHFMVTGTFNLLTTTKVLRKKAVDINSDLDTCSECSMNEIADYIYKKTKLMLEVENEKSITYI